MDEPNEPVFPVNPVANMAEFVRQANASGRANPAVPRLDPEDLAPMISDDEPAYVSASGRTISQIAMPRGPISISSVSFEDGKAHLLMTDGTRHEIPEILKQQLVAICLRAWEMAMLGEMRKFGEQHGITVQTVQETIQDQAQTKPNGSQDTIVPPAVVRRGRPPKKG